MCQRRYNWDMFHERHVNRGGMKETTWSKRFWCSETAGPTICWAGHVEPGQSSVCVCKCAHVWSICLYVRILNRTTGQETGSAFTYSEYRKCWQPPVCVFIKGFIRFSVDICWIYVGYSAVWLHRCQLLSVGPDWNISAASEGVHWNLIQTITRKKIWFELPEKSDLTYLSFLADLNRMWKMIEHRLIFQKVEKGRKI